jgi:hypothetical protein
VTTYTTPNIRNGSKRDNSNSTTNIFSVPNKLNLRIMTMHCRSIRDKQSESAALVNYAKPDIIISHSLTGSGYSIDTSSEYTDINTPPPSVPLSFLYTLKFSRTTSADLIADSVGGFPGLMPLNQDSGPINKLNNNNKEARNSTTPNIRNGSKRDNSNSTTNIFSVPNKLNLRIMTMNCRSIGDKQSDRFRLFY